MTKNNYLLQLSINKTLSNFDLNFSIDIPHNKITAIYGKSGSGKSSILKIIAGLDKKSRNNIIFLKNIWQNSTVYIPTHLRKIGMIFQDTYLFPHLNVQDNLLFNVQVVDHKLFIQLVTDFSLEYLLTRMPNKLSGGEKQKIALARALLHKPQLLLLDEPFTALDKKTSLYLLDYLKNYNIPIILVSHNLEEVIHCADYIMNISSGKISNHGIIFDLLKYLDAYSNYDLLINVSSINNNQIITPIGNLNIPVWQKLQQTSRILINANNIAISVDKSDSSILAQIIHIQDKQDFYELQCKLNNAKTITIPIDKLVFAHRNYNIGQQIYLTINFFQFV